jgi:predicted site-specific integrase-resolvase
MERLETGDLLTLDQVARLIQVKVSTLRKWSCMGTLPFPTIKVSKKAIRVERQAVIDWLKRSMRDGTHNPADKEVSP